MTTNYVCTYLTLHIVYILITGDIKGSILCQLGREKKFWNKKINERNIEVLFFLFFFFGGWAIVNPKLRQKNQYLQDQVLIGLMAFDLPATLS